MRSAAITFLLIFPLVGCATSSRSPARDSASTDWKKGDFRIHFQAGPRGREDRSYSYYEIEYSIDGQLKDSLVMESAHSLVGFRSVTNGDPQNYVRIIEDPDRKALLIEEEIPNDCGPCSNYLWVKLNPEGFLEGTYLRLPSKTTGDHRGIDYEYPKVRSLDGDVLTLFYSEGGKVTESIGQIQKADKPTPPG